MKTMALIALTILGLKVSAQEPGPYIDVMDCLTELRRASSGAVSESAPLILPAGKDSLIMRYGSAELVSGLDLSNWNTKIALTRKGELGKSEQRSVGLNANGTITYFEGAPNAEQKKFESTPVAARDQRIYSALNAELLRVGANLSDQQKGRVFARCRTMPQVIADLPQEWRNNQPTTHPPAGSGFWESDFQKREARERVDRVFEPQRPRGSMSEQFFGNGNTRAGR